MPLTDQYIPWHISAFGGQNSKVRDTLLDTKKAERAENCRFEKQPGSVTKRNPLAYYNATSLGANPLHSLFRYYTVSSKFLIAGYQGTVKVGSDSAGTFTNLVTGLTSDKKHTFVVYKGLCLFSNGFENIMATDGSGGAWELGSCKATLLAGGSNLDAAAAYYYAVTIDADAYICGAVSNTVTTDAGNRKVTLSNIPLGPAGTTNRKIYRVEGGGSTLKLLATISDNTTTTYVDDIADASLGATMGAVTDDMPKGKYLKIYRERLFVAGNETYPNRIFYSNAFLPWYIQADSNTDYADISPDDGDVIVGIPIQLGTMCVFKRNNIRKWNIDSGDPDTWFVDDPISYQGCPAPRSIAESPYGIIYLGWDHLYKFDGSQSAPIIDDFDVKEDIEGDALNQSVGFFHDNEYLLSYIAQGGGHDYFDRVMRYEWLRDAVSVDLINVSSFAAYTGDDEAGELHYGDSQNGFVYLAENFPQTVTLKTKTQLNGGVAYPGTIYSGLNDIALAGTEESPIIQIGWATTIDNAVGTINSGYSGTATIDRPDTTGTYTSEVFEINAGALDKIYWNEVQAASGGDVLFYTRTGSTEAATLAASWSASLTTPSGSTITSTPNIYFQFKIELTSAIITETPKVVFQNGFIVKFTYTPGASEVTDNIPFTYGTGKRNFGDPAMDKIYRKIVSVHEGTSGMVTIDWETEVSSGSFTFDLSTYPSRWESFFPATAYGREIKFTIRKNDRNAYKQKELVGILSPQPLII